MKREESKLEPAIETITESKNSKGLTHFISKINTFGYAVERLKKGARMKRRGWNGQGIFIELQRPTELSKMTSPYIYINTSGLKTDNKEAPKNLAPWFASQTDMLAEDWEEIKD